jgi:hypothetical protein
MQLAFEFQETKKRIQELAGVTAAKFEVLQDRYVPEYLNSQSEALKFAGITEERGSFASVRFALTTTNRQAIYAALEYFQPLSVTIEAIDLPMLIGNPIIKTAAAMNWKTIAPAFNRLEPEEIFPKIDELSMRLFTAQPSEPDTADLAYLRSRQEEAYVAELAKQGITDPLAGLNRRDAARAELQRRAEQAEQDIYERDYAEAPAEPVKRPTDLSWNDELISDSW